MLIKELWRYPVKSMAGEQLDTADITEHGIAGDRIIQVRNAAGRIFSARTRPDLLRHKAELRPNGDVLVDGRREGLAERQWEGKQLRIGNVVIGMDDLRARCIMTTFDPDTGKQDLNVLRKVQSEFEGVLGLNSYVITPGRVAVGDPVELIPRP